MILIVGGAGYVGSALCKKLSTKHNITIVDSGFFGLDGIKSLANEKKVKIINKDAFALTKEELMGVKCIINISGLANDPMSEFNFDLNEKLNTKLPIHLAKLAKECGVEKYIFASTCSIYDFGTEDDSKDVLMDEESEVAPRKYYSISKRNAEIELLKLQDKKFDVIILRKATVYGYSPRMRYDLVVNSFTKDSVSVGKMFLHGGGEVWRPMIDIEDVAEIYLRLVESNLKGIYNAVGSNIRVSEIALRVKETLQEKGIKPELVCEYNIPLSSLRSYRVSGKKLIKDLKFEPQGNIQSAVRNILENIEKIKDFNNPCYYNIRWMEKYLQYWLQYY